MRNTKRKLQLLAAFSVLLLAVAAGCKGFFVNATVTSIAVSPPTPTIANTAPNNTQQFTVVATFDDGSHGGTPVSWSSDTPTVATITTSGLATAQGVGTSTITAASTPPQPIISGTAKLTVVPGNVTSINVTPSSQGATTGSLIFLKAVDQGGNDLSAAVTWTFTLQGTTTVETGITKTSVVDPTQGQQFQVNALTPTAAFPATLNVVASLTVNGTTVSSSATAVTVTITG